MKFAKINKLFDPKEWDIGMLNKEEMLKCANSPLKIHYNSPGMKYNSFTDSMWKKFKSALIVVRFTPDPAIYDFYYEVSDILKEVKGWRHIYFDYKKAAIYAGLGVRAKNSLVHNRKFAFNCKILALGFEEEITDYERKEPDFDILKACIGCDDCLRNCPVDAIKHEGLKEKGHWIDWVACDKYLGKQLREEWKKTQNPLMTDYEFEKLELKDIIWKKNGFSYDLVAPKLSE